MKDVVMGNKKYGTNPPGLIELFDHYHNVYSSESDDEKLAYAAVEHLESLLRQILTKYLLINLDEGDDLLDDERPLSGFRGKANMAFRLGLISRGLRDELMLIRSIRKEFRESIDCFELDYRDAKTYCDKLKAPSLLMHQATSPVFRDRFSDTPRGRFELAISVMSTLLHNTLIHLRSTNRVPLY